jgi:hypothetical protein
MGAKQMLITAVLCALSCLLAFGHLQAAGPKRQEKINGPRLGITYVMKHESFDRDGTLLPKLEARGTDNIISQFGWHFEWVVTPEAEGPCFLTQLVPFIRGMEYGIVIPSASLALGMRMPAGFDFFMGPNVLVTFDKDEPFNTSLLVGAGYNVRYGGVQIPINMAVSTSKAGNQVSLVVGYAMPRRQRRSRNPNDRHRRWSRSHWEQEEEREKGQPYSRNENVPRPLPAGKRAAETEGPGEVPQAKQVYELDEVYEPDMPR